jgi:hypothetical protein
MPKTSLRIKSLLPLALLVAAWQFSASALGQTVIISPDVVASSSTPTKSREHTNASGVDCANLVPQNEEGQPFRNSVPPDSSSDIDVSDTDLDDVSADLSARNDQDPPHFSVTSLDAGATRTPRIVPILLFPVHCFYCLHAHIRERAPPIPGLTKTKSFPCFTSSHSAFGNRHSPFARFGPSSIPVIRICFGFPNPAYL